MHVLLDAKMQLFPSNKFSAPERTYHNTPVCPIIPDVPQLSRSFTYAAIYRRAFVLFHGNRHPLEMGEPQVVEVFTHLVVRANELTPRIRQCLLFVRS